MTTSTRVQIRLQEDSGSLLYSDAEDGVIFHIEPMADPGEDTAATTELVKSFLRQHLLKNGESSHSVQPLMRSESVGPLLMLNAVTAVHLQKDAGLGGSAAAGTDGCSSVQVAVQTIHKTLGTLVSMLQQREKALRAVGALSVGWKDGLGVDEAK